MPGMGYLNPYEGGKKSALGFGNKVGSTNSGSATSSPYSNPNMTPYGGKNSYGGGQNPYIQPGWYNPNSGESQYLGGMAPKEAGWEGPAPGHHGQALSYNPFTGQKSWENASGGVQVGGANPYGKGAITWTDPTTGLTSIDPGALQSLLSGLGLGGGNNDVAQVDIDPWEPEAINLPDEYTPYEYKQQLVDPSDVIAKSQPLIQKGLNDMFAQAGQKAGQSGWAMSTGYTGDLGESAKWASDENAKLIAGLQYDAAKLASEQFQEQQLQAGAQDYSGWAQHGNWDVNSQLQGQALGQDAWKTEVGADIFNAGQQNQYGNQDEIIQAQILAQIMGGLF